MESRARDAVLVSALELRAPASLAGCASRVAVRAHFRGRGRSWQPSAVQRRFRAVRREAAKRCGESAELAARLQAVAVQVRDLDPRSPLAPQFPAGMALRSRGVGGSVAAHLRAESTPFFLTLVRARARARHHSVCRWRACAELWSPFGTKICEKFPSDWSLACHRVRGCLRTPVATWREVAVRVRIPSLSRLAVRRTVGGADTV